MNPLRPNHSSTARTLRLVLAALVVVAATGLLLTLLFAADTGLSIWQRLQRLPTWLGWVVGLLFAIIVAVTGWLLWRLLRTPARARRLPSRHELPLDQHSVRQRLAHVRTKDTAAALPALAGIDRELGELGERAGSGDRFLAAFGEISAGKSSLLNALAGDASRATDVRGGTTTGVALSRIHWPGVGTLVCADVPGANEWLGEQRAVAARAEALRAHLVLYIASGDLTASEWAELDWLKSFGKPLLLVLNKVDRYDEPQRRQLLERLRQRAGGIEVVPASAGGTETIAVEHADGRRESRERPRPADVAALQHAVRRLLMHYDRPELELRRERAVLRGIDAQLGEVEAGLRRDQADALVERYARRAVIGGLAAVAPGTDLLIQGVLGSQLVRELCALYGRKLREVDADEMVKLAGGRLRGSSALVLAIAGNAAKAFPGLGTLGGGLLHAVAYGMIFASLGRALVTALEAGELEREAVLTGFEQRLADRDLLTRLAPDLLKLALREWRAGSGARAPDREAP